MDHHEQNSAGSLMRCVEQVLTRQLSAPLAAGLYLVSTPIGNLADISLRALALLANADLVYCEDKRHSAKLLNHYGISTVLRSYHEHNADRQRGVVLANVEQGLSVALISDAGTPLVSDPGYKLVVEARDRDLLVVAIPGASAPIAALVSVGLPTDSFLFAGFLPAKKAARRKRLDALAKSEATLVFFESPKRLKASLQDMFACYGARPAGVARELTKLHETVVTGDLGALCEQFLALETIKGEIVVLVGAASKEDISLDDEALNTVLRRELQRGSLRDAVRSVCARYDLPRSRVYNLAVEIKKRMEGEGQ